MAMTDLNLEWLISVDDHILEPPRLWVDRVAARDRDRVPHTVDVNGIETWVYDGKQYPGSGSRGRSPGSQRRSSARTLFPTPRCVPAAMTPLLESKTWTGLASSPPFAFRRSRDFVASFSWRRATVSSALSA